LHVIFILLQQGNQLRIKKQIQSKLGYQNEFNGKVGATYTRRGLEKFHEFTQLMQQYWLSPSPMPCRTKGSSQAERTNRAENLDLFALSASISLSLSLTLSVKMVIIQSLRLFGGFPLFQRVLLFGSRNSSNSARAYTYFDGKLWKLGSHNTGPVFCVKV
jgi:hypothetical protein